MRTTLLLLAFLTLLDGIAFADGYPFDSTTQEVFRDTLRIRLNEKQAESVAVHGKLTFTDAQLKLVRHFYPRAAKSQSVIAATFNDNNEGLTDDDVDIFWVAAEEIAITLNPKVLASKRLRSMALTQKPWVNQSDMRITPYGEIYIAGKKASLEDALDVIAKESKKPDREHGQVDVCVAPPFRSDYRGALKAPDGEWRRNRELDEAVAALFKNLVEAGENHNVVVAKSW
jgi:hypothetical protein